MNTTSILEKLKAGDDQAWEDEFPQLWEVAFAAARLRGISYEDCEDVAIEAIKGLSHRIASAKSMEAVGKLLWSISQNCAINLIRRNRAKKRPQTVSVEQIGPRGEVTSLLEMIPDGKPPEISVPSTSRGETNIPELMSYLPGPKCESDREELHKMLSKAIEPLAEPGRSIWMDHIWEGLSSKELSKKYGKTPGTIRVLFFRANAKFTLILSKSLDLMKRLSEFLR